MQILQAALKEDCSAGKLSDMACGDPAFAGRILSWVNSPAFRRSRTVVDVRQAASLLGIRGMRTVALSMVLADRVPDSPKASVLLANGLRRALAAHTIAEQILRDEADAAFTVGLFLEVGLLELATRDLDRACDLSTGPSAHRPVRERALGLVPHTELGVSIAQGYGMPEPFIDAIAHHHDAEPPETPLSRVAWLAERFASVFEGGPVAEERRVAEKSAEQVGIQPDVCEALIDFLPAMVEDGAKIFERDVGAQASFQDLLLDANAQLLQLNTQYEQTVQSLETVIREKEQLAQELKNANEKLVELATKDPLTGLANRRALTEALERDLARAIRERSSLCVAVLDLDHFKQVNDTYGHDGGDAVLAHVAHLLKEAVREADFVARFGGEELVLVLPNTNCQQAEIVLERVRHTIESNPTAFGAQHIRATASFGAACAGVGRFKSPTEVFKAADEALYAAKHGGRNRVVLASECCEHDPTVELKHARRISATVG